MSRPKLSTAFLFAIVSSLFMSSGMVVSSLLNAQGLHWAWTASLRFLLLLPMLLVVTAGRKRLLPLLKTFGRLPGTFLLWGNLGFGGYYALLVYATRLLPSWLVMAAFMTTILAGILLAPLIYKDHRAAISKRALGFALLLLVCLSLLELDQLFQLNYSWLGLIGLLLAFAAAILWPLSNRLLMLQLEKHRAPLDPLQRSLGMTIGSLPVLFALAFYAYRQSGPPAQLQLFSSMTAAFLSGLVGCVLFFKALNLTQKQPLALAAVEATQILAIFFTLLGERLVRQLRTPGPLALIGMAGIMLTLALYIRQIFQKNLTRS